jgi:hypothetical protein
LFLAFSCSKIETLKEEEKMLQTFDTQKNLSALAVSKLTSLLCHGLTILWVIIYHQGRVANKNKHKTLPKCCKTWVNHKLFTSVSPYGRGGACACGASGSCLGRFYSINLA